MESRITLKITYKRRPVIKFNRDRIFVKNYRFFSFDKNMSKNIGKKSKNLSGKCNQQLFAHAK